MTIADWTFTKQDQESFARLSGDRNPMHMDAVAARRTTATAPVVHGVHALLRALDAIASSRSLTNLRAVRAQFSKFIYLDRSVSLEPGKSDETSMRANLTSAGETLASIVLSFGPREAGAAAPSRALLTLTAVALEPSFEAMATASARLSSPVPLEDFERAFPKLSAAIGVQRVAGLALLSTIVGMVCPGLHSIFDALNVKLVDDIAPGISFTTKRTNPRFHTVQMEVAGSGLSGEVSAFERPAPTATETMQALSGRIKDGEFNHVRALVVGGSRGLGATAAKLLALGGAHVTITFLQGSDDAAAVATDINASRGTTACATLRLDATAPIAPQLEAIERPSHLYWFATTSIAKQRGPRYAPELFREFLRVYVDALEEAVEHLRTGGPLRVLYPSSIFVAERPKGMMEYAMAKAAGEVLCVDLGSPTVKILAPRLPRVVTDQTATIVPSEAQKPADVLLPLLRELG